jgi:hypothetical protein
VAVLRVEGQQAGRQPEFRRLVVAIADELERVEVMTADDLRILMTSTENAWNT